MNVMTCTTETCPLVLNSKCVFYESSALPYTGIATNDSVQTSLQKIEAAIADIINGGAGSGVWGSITGTITNQTDLINYISDNYVPETRNLTINGTTFDLSADRSWTITSITNSAVNGELAMSDGTNLISSGIAAVNIGTIWGIGGIGGGTVLISGDTAANSLSLAATATNFLDINNVANEIRLRSPTIELGSSTIELGGTGVAGTDRNLNVVGSGSDINVSIVPKGTGVTNLRRTVFAAHTATAGTAPIKLTSGTAMTTPEDGAVEFHTSHLYFTIAGVRYQIDQQGVVSLGGTGLSTISARSIWVANTLDTITTLTPGAGQSIRINAGNTAWEAFTPSSGGSVAGADTQVQFNDGGAFGADSGLTYNKTNDALTIGGARIFTINKALDDLFIGESAGNFTTTGVGGNIGIGSFAGDALTTGQENTFLGYNTGTAVTTGTANTFLGAEVGQAVVSGSRNVFIGVGAGQTDAYTGTSNVILGAASSGLRLQSVSASGQLTIQNAIFGLDNTTNGTTVASGNIGFYATTWGASAARVLAWGNGTTPTTSPADSVQIYARDVAASSEWFVLDESGFETQLS